MASKLKYARLIKPCSTYNSISVIVISSANVFIGHSSDTYDVVVKDMY